MGIEAARPKSPAIATIGRDVRSESSFFNASCSKDGGTGLGRLRVQLCLQFQLSNMIAIVACPHNVSQGGEHVLGGSGGDEDARRK